MLLCHSALQNISLISEGSSSLSSPCVMSLKGLSRHASGLVRRLQRGSQHHAAWCSIASRMSTTSAGDTSAQREEEIAELLRSRMPGAQAVRVLDTSGGCGSMYRIEIAADEFRWAACIVTCLFLSQCQTMHLDVLPGHDQSLCGYADNTVHRVNLIMNIRPHNLARMGFAGARASSSSISL